MKSLALLARRVVSCRGCPRLVAYHKGIAADHADWHCAPVPGFGDARARTVLVGLAPSKTGGNRTSRIFTGDKTAEFLFQALHRVGWSNQDHSLRAGDGLRLNGLYLTPALKCAPPQDQPTPEELRRCFPFLQKELELLKPKVVIALGKIAHDAFLRFKGLRLSEHPFSHGAVHRLDTILVDTYHCSPRNTNTGRLTMPALVRVLRRAKDLARR